ncbi:MAG: hypothetical protein FWE16_03585 [Firmicutes bacterium]|nr:hypothetical protein [Bacillota bacterium]
MGKKQRIIFLIVAIGMLLYAGISLALGIYLLRTCNNGNGYKDDDCYYECNCDDNKDDDCDDKYNGIFFTPNVANAGVYWWRAISNDNLENSLHLLNFVERNGITDIFLTMNDLVNVSGATAGIVENGSFNASLMERFIAPTQTFIRSAFSRGINVYTLFDSGGGIIFPNSPSKNNFHRRMFGLQVFNHISGPEEQITGIQFNIEPHQHGNWRNVFENDVIVGNRNLTRETRRNDLLQMKADFVVEITTLYSDMFRIDWCMPFWWDARHDYQLITHNGNPNTQLYQAIINEITRSTKGGRVLVMSFRSTAVNMYNISSHIVEYAFQHNIPVFLMATVNESTGPHTRFHEAGKIEMYYQLNRLRYVVNQDFVAQNLLGVSIHHIMSWYPLQYERIPN